MYKARRAKLTARLVVAIVLLLGTGSLLSGGPIASAGVPVRASNTTSAAQPASKIAPDVVRATASGQVAPIAILLADQADLSAAYGITDRNARGRYVYNTLKAHADKTQVGLRSELDALGVTYSAYWVANVIFAQGDRKLVEKLAARSDVKRIESNASRRMITDPIAPTVPQNPSSPQVVEWNVERVHAPEVWNLGYEGSGIVIGINDTGVQWDHAALRPQYRGWNGVTADHNYNWHDAIDIDPGACPGSSPVPCDGYNHGTHVAGIAVGDDGSTNQIGVAPGAEWIACRSMTTAGDGTPQTYTECFQFFLAPYDLAGMNANPNLRPHIVNNSWGCTPGEGCDSANLQTLKPVVENVQAAGIFVASSSGNSGSSCGSVDQPPAIYDATFATGATTSGDALAGFSSRGPVTVDGSNRLKPNIVAPGVSIRSSVNSGGYSFFQGTSMASPHVAGTVALLWDAWDGLQRDITTTKTLLQDSADPNVSVPGNQVCGGTPPTTIPNNLFGYGLVDAYAAVLEYCPGTSPDVYVSEGFCPPVPSATPTATPTATSVPATPTSTSVLVTPTSTPTPTSLAATPTSTAIPATPTSTSISTSTSTSVPGTPTATSAPGTPTSTSVLATPTSTPTPTSVPGTPTSTAIPATPTSTGCSIQFDDVPPSGEGSTFYSFVRCLACRSIVGGYPCGGPGEPCNADDAPYFRPNANVTRGQISKMVALAADLSGPLGDQVFEDVAPGSTFYAPVQRLATAGYISGYPCGTVPAEPCQAGDRPYFRPSQNATRGQLSKIVSETAQLTGDPGDPRFTDVPEDNPFFVWINRLSNQGVISGYSCGGPGEPCDDQDLPYFRPAEQVTRGQTAKIVANTFYPNCQTPAGP